MTTLSFDSTQSGTREAWSRESVTSPETTLQEQMGKVFGYIKGLHATHLIDISAKLGLFKRLAETPSGLPPESLVAELKLHPKYVRLWCETACALELLDYDPDKGYRFAPFTRLHYQRLSQGFVEFRHTS